MRLDLTARLDQHHLVVAITVAEADQVLLLVVALFLQEHKAEALALIQDQEAIVRLVVAVAHLVAIAHQVVVVAAARVEVTVRQVVAVVARLVVAAQVAAAVAHLAVDLAGEVNRSYII